MALDSLCCHYPWNSYWIEEFSRSNYFYVVNLREVLVKNLRISSGNRRRNWIRENKDNHDYPQAWLDVFPREFSAAWCRANGIDGEGDEIKQEFDRETTRLGFEVFAKAHNGMPVSFPKAALIISVMHNALTQQGNGNYSGDPRDYLYIDFANFYLEGFEQIYRSQLEGVRNASERGRLYKATLQRNERLLDDLARGYPVTKSTAESILAYCSDNLNAKPLLRFYESRTENDDDRLDRLNGKSSRRQKRAALSEIVRFAPPE